jgi:hypothetical protein
LGENDFRRVQVKRVIQNLKCYYNFFSNSNSELRSTIFSDNQFSILVKYTDVREEVDMPVNNAIEDKVVEEIIDFKKLKEKRKTTNSFLKLSYKNNLFNDDRSTSPTLNKNLPEIFFCELCPGKTFKNQRGLNIHKVWHKKLNSKN